MASSDEAAAKILLKEMMEHLRMCRLHADLAEESTQRALVEHELAWRKAELAATICPGILP